MRDPVVKRTLFYEGVNRQDRQVIHFLPWYQVLYPGLGGKVFEPVDCMKQREMGDDATSGSLRGIKEVHEMKEWNGGARLFECEKKPDGQSMTLHSFDWDWPE